MLRIAIILAAVAVCHVQSANRYLLYTRANQLVPVNMTIADEVLPELFKPEENTIILIHGQSQSTSSRFNLLILQEILSFQNRHNVIVVDWENKASHVFANLYVPSVANDLSRFLKWLVTTTPPNDGQIDITSNVNIRTVHLVGFGLGAHVAGIASRQLRDTPGVVGRITGLNPTGSLWSSNPARLRDTDADYVEVIHTGSGVLGYGIGDAIGQVNFYANGGSNQPGCLTNSCSHDRAYELFAASMRRHLHGNACSSTLQLLLNLCRGKRLEFGGTALSKPNDHSLYIINTGRDYPY